MNSMCAIIAIALAMAFATVASAQDRPRQASQNYDNRPRWAVNENDANTAAQPQGNRWYESGEYEVMGDFNNPHFPMSPPPDVDAASVAPYQPKRYSSPSNVTNDHLVLTEPKWVYMQTSLPKSQTDADRFAWVVVPAGSRIDMDGDAPKFYRGVPGDARYIDCRNLLVAIAERLPEESFEVPRQRPTQRMPAQRQEVTYNRPQQTPVVNVRIENNPTNTNTNTNTVKNTSITAVADIVRSASNIYSTMRNGQRQGQAQRSINNFPQRPIFRPRPVEPPTKVEPPSSRPIIPRTGPNRGRI